MGWANSSVLLPDAVKAAFAAMLLATMTSLTVHMMNLRRNHAKAVKAQIEALKEEARRSQELLQAEQNYTRARELALCETGACGNRQKARPDPGAH